MPLGLNSMKVGREKSMGKDRADVDSQDFAMWQEVV